MFAVLIFYMMISAPRRDGLEGSAEFYTAGSSAQLLSKREKKGVGLDYFFQAFHSLMSASVQKYGSDSLYSSLSWEFGGSSLEWSRVFNSSHHLCVKK